MIPARPFLKSGPKTTWQQFAWCSKPPTVTVLMNADLCMHSGADHKLQLMSDLSVNSYSPIDFSALTLLVGVQEGHPACKNWVVRYWHGYLSGVRCKWFAHGSAGATATPSSLPPVKSRTFNFLLLAYPGCPGNRPLNVCISSSSLTQYFVRTNKMWNYITLIK